MVRSDTAETSIIAFVETLRDRIQIYYTAMTVLEKLADSTNKIDSYESVTAKLRTFQKVIDNGELTELLKSMFNAVNEAFLTSEWRSIIENQGDISTTFAGMSLGMDVLSDALSVLATSMAGFDDNSISAFSSTLDVLGRLAQALIGSNTTQDQLSKAFSGNHTLSKVGFEFKQFGGYIQSFYNSIKDIPGFKEEEMAETARKTNAIINLVRDISNALANYLTYGRTSDMISTVTEELPGFATTIATFFDAVNNAIPADLSVERSEVLLNAVESTSDLIQSLSSLRQWMLSNNAEDISKRINAVYNALMSVEGDNSTLSNFADTIKILHDAIAIAMKDEKNLTGYEEAGEAIAHALHTGIQNAFDTDPDLKVRITPILNIDDNTKKMFTDSFNGGAFNVGGIARLTMGANTQVDQDRIDSMTLYTKIDAVASAVNDLAGKQVSVSDVTNAFASMRIVTDTGAMVGEITDDIDAAIGRKIWLIERGITAQ